MTETTDDRQGDMLETYFEAARASPPIMPQGLLARIQADAAAAQPKPAARWRDWVKALGGVPALGGLMTATCVGVWIGIAPPEQLPDMGGFVLGYETNDNSETAAFGWDAEEG